MTSTMKDTSPRKSFADEITELDQGLPKGMSECEKYGMTWGCDTGCPVLRRGECEHKDTENKELYKECLKEMEE